MAVREDELTAERQTLAERVAELEEHMRRCDVLHREHDDRANSLAVRLGKVERETGLSELEKRL
jgi:hypothetical protein